MIPLLVTAPLAVVGLVWLIVCLGCWIASLLSGDHSWVDRIWSIVPVVYLWIFAGWAHLADARLDLMAVLVTLWGARLTFNFARKGGYRGVEDYRWAVLRGRMSRTAFAVFNLLFIVIYQNLLLVLITLPAWTALNHGRPMGGPGIGVADIVLAILFVGCLAGETVADQQQWRFHRYKAEEARAGRLVRPGFLRTGLFRYSRHPNFFFEQAQWWLIFFFGVSAARSVLQPTVLGPVLLTVLFIGSTVFTESISRSKYPEYDTYRATTSMLIPWFPRHGARLSDPSTGTTP